MEDKKQNVQENEKKQTQEKKQDVLELIEDSLGGVSGGVQYGGMTNIDNYNHFGSEIGGNLNIEAGGVVQKVRSNNKAALNKALGRQ